MRKILVPLDGSAFAEAIIPDALRFAGSGGRLVVMHELSHPAEKAEDESLEEILNEGEAYLERLERSLRERGVIVESVPLALPDPVMAIDEAARLTGADGMAIATHGRGAIARLVEGGTAWKALAHSTVPVMLRHIDAERTEEPANPVQRAILVPLDGSTHAESALPLAEELAREWNASIRLVRVAPPIVAPLSPYDAVALATEEIDEGIAEVQSYLDELARTITVEVHTQTESGPVVDSLVEVIDENAITDVVMTSHGRTGLSLVVLGSVADRLVHQVRIPVIVIPSGAEKHRRNDAAPVGPQTTG